LKKTSVTINFVEYYDYTNNRIRLDRVIRGTSTTDMYFLDKGTIHSITNGSSCAVRPIPAGFLNYDNGTKHLDGPDFDLFVSNFHALQFFYTGVREHRGIICDVWSAFYTGSYYTPALTFNDSKLWIDFYFTTSTWQNLNPLSNFNQIPVRIEMFGSLYGGGFGNNTLRWRDIEHDFNYFDFVVGVPDPSNFYTCDVFNQRKNSSSNSNSNGVTVCPTCPTCSNPNVAAIGTASFFGGVVFMIIVFIFYQMRQKPVANPNFNIEDPSSTAVSAQLAALANDQPSADTQEDPKP